MHVVVHVAVHDGEASAETRLCFRLGAVEAKESVLAFARARLVAAEAGGPAVEIEGGQGLRVVERRRVLGVDDCAALGHLDLPAGAHALVNVAELKEIAGVRRVRECQLNLVVSRRGLAVGRRTRARRRRASESKVLSADYSGPVIVRAPDVGACRRNPLG